MRSPQFCPETYIEGGKTETNAWEGIRDALVACPIRGLLFAELDAVLDLPTFTQEADSIPYAAKHGCESRIVRIGTGKCGLGLVEQDIPELSYLEAGAGGSGSRNFQCRIVVLDNCCCETNWVAGVDIGPISDKVI
jgi:hypothetical protein